MPPNQTNSGRGRSRHWRAAHEERNAYWRDLDALQAAGLIPPPPPEPIQRARITSHMTLRGAMDDDNAMARHKRLLDWLVTRGYLAGDRRKHLTWTGLPTQRVTRKAPATIRLEIHPETREAA